MKKALVVFLQSSKPLHELDHGSHEDGCNELQTLIEADSINSVTVVSTHSARIFEATTAPLLDKDGILDRFVEMFPEAIRMKINRYPRSVSDEALRCPRDEIIQPIADFAGGSGVEQVLIVLPGKSVPDSVEVNECSEDMLNNLHVKVLMLSPPVLIDFL